MRVVLRSGRCWSARAADDAGLAGVSFTEAVKDVYAAIPLQACRGGGLCWPTRPEVFRSLRLRLWGVGQALAVGVCSLVADYISRALVGPSIGWRFGAKAGIVDCPDGIPEIIAMAGKGTVWLSSRGRPACQRRLFRGQTDNLILKGAMSFGKKL